MQTTILSLFTVTIYFLTGILLAIRLFTRKDTQPESWLYKKTRILVLGLTAVGLHSVVLYNTLFVAGGLDLGFFNAGSLILWLIALTILLAAFANPVENLGIILLPMAGVSILLVLLFPVEHTLQPAQAMELKIHILMSIMATALLTIAAVHAVILSIQDKHLRNRKPGGFIRALPPLETMENLLFQMIGLGFFLHSLSLITGMIYLEDMFAQHIAHKTILSIVSWFVFAILLWGRWRFGWRGSTAIRWTLAGFFVLLLAYMGSKWVLEIILGR
ncbi:MAG: cytochrome c biogenesis protein CcsA [Gammaproteobacteria bacterium]|nr:cytochrome c biogenesis protein CcsA [Gammaproteobacteria bacterium]